jgi:hypothetical protein
MITTTRYGGVVNDWDQSDSKSLYGVLPSTSFVLFLACNGWMTFVGVPGGTVLAENFSTREVGPVRLSKTPSMQVRGEGRSPDPGRGGSG